jgi:hypothetical protein
MDEIAVGVMFESINFAGKTVDSHDFREQAHRIATPLTTKHLRNYSAKKKIKINQTMLTNREILIN